MNPLMHTLLKLNLSQDIESLNSGAKAPRWSMKGEYSKIERTPYHSEG